MTHAEILASIRLVAFSNMVYGQGQSVILKKNIFLSLNISKKFGIFSDFWSYMAKQF